MTEPEHVVPCGGELELKGDDPDCHRAMLSSAVRAFEHVYLVLWYSVPKETRLLRFQSSAIPRM
jgi:hypothetical protein